MKNEADERRNALPRRFYSEVSVATVAEGGHAVLLDQRSVRTPGRRQVVLPTAAAAALVAAEFSAQEKVIDPALMPVTRLVNSALDGIQDGGTAVRADILTYAGTDLLCYRAESPEALLARQQGAWDPVLHWTEQKLGARMRLTSGIVHVAQSDEALAAIGAHLEHYREPLVLAALHSMTTLTGSALLAIALAQGGVDWEKAWEAAHVDEDWNIAQWGEDYEAAERRQRRKSEMKAAAQLLAAALDRPQAE